MLQGSSDLSSSKFHNAIVRGCFVTSSMKRFFKSSVFVSCFFRWRTRAQCSVYFFGKYEVFQVPTPLPPATQFPPTLPTSNKWNACNKWHCEAVACVMSVLLCVYVWSVALQCVYLLFRTIAKSDNKCGRYGKIPLHPWVKHSFQCADVTKLTLVKQNTSTEFSESPINGLVTYCVTERRTVKRTCSPRWAFP